ncbi:MAG: translation initiation factor IF-2 [Arsenophonus sp.]|nr:MAG: translation initiation factor IF-2 [Arsenophonus sp.]
MVEQTLKLFAKEIKISTERLIKQFHEIGIEKKCNDIISQKEKEILLDYLNNNHNGLVNNQINKLILQKKIKTILNVPITGGKSKSINVEVRKKRKYIQYDIVKPESDSKNTNNKMQNIEINLEKNDSSILNKNDLINKKPQFSLKEKKIYINTIKKIKKELKVTEIYKNKEKNKKKLAKEIKLEKTIFDKKNNKFNKNKNIKNNYLDISFKEKEDIINNNNLSNIKNYIQVRNKKNIKQKKNYHFYDQNNIEQFKNFTNKNNKEKIIKKSKLQQNFRKPIASINKNILIPETISIVDLSNKMAIKSSKVIKNMKKMGFSFSINEFLDQETAQLVVEEMGHKAILQNSNNIENELLNDRSIENVSSEIRPPIVTIMGHVDHGKTTLLDYIRSSQITQKELGGITQRIGAYHVKTKNGAITFLDTPGHAAFSEMRFRGVKITDIVVLIVAADDGVMPQTIEAIKHVKRENVSIIVAINKIDKNVTDLERIKNQLSKYDILSEEWGGDVQFVKISAKTGYGVDTLLESILLQSEMLELRSISVGRASGVIIESYLDQKKGVIATVLVQKGMLSKGDIVLSGFQYGKIRAMYDEFGKEILSAGPSIPVEILGFSDILLSGDTISVVRNEKKAREIATYRLNKFKEIKLKQQKRIKLEKLFSNMKNNHKVLNIILKTDVQGSIEAIINSIKLLSNEIRVHIISFGVGSIKENDAILAISCHAMIIGFNVRCDLSAKKIIEKEKIDCRFYSVIYQLINDIKKIIIKLSSQEDRKKIIGVAEVKNIFMISKKNIVAGCKVINGIIKRNNNIRLLRDDIVIHEGMLESLRRFKNDIHEVKNGMECGIVIKDFYDISSGDIIESLDILNKC